MISLRRRCWAKGGGRRRYRETNEYELELALLKC
jgi:hypothetical protein